MPTTQGRSSTCRAGPAIRLRGVPRLLLPSGEKVLERKPAGLLAFVALQRECSRAMLAALLWPAAEAEGARNNLRQALFKLRKAAGQDLVIGVEVLSIAPGVELDLHEGASDEQALLEGCEFRDCTEFAEWLEGERNLQSIEFAARLEARAQAAEASGDLVTGLQLSLELLRAVPLDEAHHRRLMRLHYLRGDRAAALAAFETCAQMVRRELSAELSAETRELAASIGVEGAPKRSAAGAVPVTLMRPPRMIGRDPELAVLDDAWSNGRAFVVLGDAGLGKSRLAAEFTLRSSAVMVSARPGDASVPYAAFARLLRAVLEGHEGELDESSRRELARLLPELRSELPRAEANRSLMQRAVAKVLLGAAGRGSTGFVVDDLHFADAASLEMLEALAEEEGLRFGFTQRPAEGLAQAHALRASLGERWKLEAVRLAPFDDAQMVQFVDSLGIEGISGAALGPQLLKATGGNPQFALETLKSALASQQPLTAASPLPRPASVGALIERRLAQLSAPALALARVAAIAGSDFNAEVAARVMQTPALALADAWRELEDAQVLREAAFAHDLIYEATLRGVPAPTARHAHGVIAAHLLGREGEPARIAEHWIAAGEPGSAVPFLKAAAVKAERAARFDDARALLERGVAITTAARLRKESLELRFLLIELLKDVGDRKEILAIIEDMHADAATPEERFLLARAEVQGLSAANEFDRAVQVAEALLEDELLCAQAPPLRVAELRYAIGDTLLAQRRAREALVWLEPMEAQFSEHPDLQFRGWYFSDLARALFLMDRIPEAERQLVTALDLARKVGRKRMVSGVLFFAAQLSSAVGRLQEPADRLREAQLLVADMEESMWSGVCHALLGGILVDQGHYREAIEEFERSSAHGLLPPLWTRRVEATLEVVWAHLGQGHRSRQLRREGDLQGPLRSILRTFRIEAMLLLGETVETPLREYEEGVEALSESARWRLDFWRARANVAAGTLAHFETLASEAASRGLEGHRLEAHIAAARCARAAADAAATARHGKAALELLRRFTMTSCYRPLLWLELHQLLARIDPAQAAVALREGASWVKTVARYHVPEEFRESFLKANRVNRTLLETERAAGAAAGR